MQNNDGWKTKCALIKYARGNCNYFNPFLHSQYVHSCHPVQCPTLP